MTEPDLSSVRQLWRASLTGIKWILLPEEGTYGAIVDVEVIYIK